VKIAHIHNEERLGNSSPNRKFIALGWVVLLGPWRKSSVRQGRCNPIGSLSIRLEPCLPSLGVLLLTGKNHIEHYIVKSYVDASNLKT
jgi:hypothetical protein